MWLIAKASEYNQVYLTIEEKYLTLATRSEKTTAEETISIEGGEPLDISFNIAYLTDFVNTVGGKHACDKFQRQIQPNVVAK